MAPGCVNILMHYGGAFADQDPLTYDGGEVQLFRNIDKDVMSYFHVLELAKSVGFKDGDNMFYGVPGRSLEASIDLLKDDTSVCEMLKFANQTDFLEIYIQHKEHGRGGKQTVGNTVQDTDNTKMGKRAGTIKLNKRRDKRQNGSGFGWDDDRKMVVGDKEQFGGWAKSRPGAAALYIKLFVNYDKLCEIYATDLAK
ncbi:hypothetical protein U9M48_026784 [Paspalum notatum var. saurae]|uniref:PB1-like domain-containing protein n=1 Tax=Paspalum notatum var. saurae TaxID=547442 RepID=A0AAQ3WZB2_PASNO